MTTSRINSLDSCIRLLGYSLVAMCFLTFCGCKTTEEKSENTRSNSDNTKYGSTLGIETFDAAWRIIHESHYDTNFNGLDWLAVREEMRPKAESAQNVRQLRMVIEQMLAKLGQSHMAVIPGAVADEFDPKIAKINQKKGTEISGDRETEREGDGQVGFDVRLLDGQVVVTKVAQDGSARLAGVKPGWILESIEKQNLVERIKKMPPELDARKKEFLTWRLVRGLLMGEVGTLVNATFRDAADRPINLSLERAKQPGEPVKFGLLPTLYAHLEHRKVETISGKDVAWIHFNVWMIPVALQFDRIIDDYRSADGIVIDLRGNLGGIAGMIMGIAGHFLNDRVALGTMKTRGNDLTFYANPRRVNYVNKRVEPYSGPVAILTDSITLSAAEIFAGGMQGVKRARVFGQISGGQALPALWDRLPNGDVLYHVFADYVTSSGERLESRGVIPDEPVVISRKDLISGEDPVLKAALEWIDRQK